jgi:ATP-dependent helicase HrpB
LAETLLTFDEPSASVRARRIRRLDALRLADEPVPVDDAEAAAHLLAQAAARRVIDLLPWSKEQKAWRARANFLRSTLGDEWPDLSADALAPSVAEWLAPALFGLTKLNEITGEHLRTALDLLLPYARRQEIEAVLPSHFTAPTGNAVPINYTAEGGPAIDIRVQELFGLTRHPTIAHGRIRLLLVLLSPAHRPIQTTRDLVGFWNGSWADVARDLKGRYPRHPWPDEPAKAAPTASAKPRGT